MSRNQVQDVSLRSEFAQDDVQRGDQGEGDRDRDAVGGGSRDARREARQQRLDQIGERRLADPTEGERGDGDAELRGSQVGVEVVDRPLQRGSVPATGSDEFRDASAPHGDQTELGADGKAVCRNENK